MSAKPLEQHFISWEAHVFGYGYGTGEKHILPALQKLMAKVSLEDGYNFKDLEHEVGATVAWLLLNTLHHHRIFEYGTSPRYAWLTETGKVLKNFMDTHTSTQLIELSGTLEYVCCPDVCNCDENDGNGDVCPNPFWNKSAAVAAGRQRQ